MEPSDDKRREVERLGPWFQNLHLPDGTETCPNHQLGDFPAFKWKRIASYLPHSLEDLTALDVRRNAGFYSFELARRGAQVTAIDSDLHYLDQARWAAAQYGLSDRIELEHQIRLGVGSDGRIGPKFLYASPGYGGSCFGKDVQALIETGREHGVELELCGATHRVNSRQKGTLLHKLKRRFHSDLRSRRIGVWGISFKPRTDDIRESPALTLMDGLLSEGAEVTAHDPAARFRAEAYFERRVRLVDSAYAAAEGADALVLVTEWQEYKSPDFERLRSIMRTPVLLDDRNVWSNYGLREQGFVYEGSGVRGI